MALVLIPAGYPRVDEIRSRIVDVLGDALPSPWTESVFFPPDLGREGGDKRSRLFSVEVGDTAITTSHKHRRGIDDYDAEPWQADTDFVIRFGLSLKVDGLRADLAGAHATEAAVIGALLASGMTSTNTHEIEIGTIRREVRNGQYFVCSIECTVAHVLVIAADDGS